MRQIWLLLAFLGIVFTGVAGCSKNAVDPGQKNLSISKPDSGGPSHGSLATIRSRGELRIGIAPQAPWSVRSKAGANGENELVGFDIDLARRLAEDLGVRPNFIITPLAELLPGLMDSRYDVIISGFSITPERALFASFSKPVAELSFEMLLNQKATRGRRSLSDLDKPDITVGAVHFTVAEAVAREKLPRASKVSLTTYDEVLEKLLAGEISAAVLPGPIANAALKGFQEKLSPGPANPLSQRPEAIAFRREDRDLKDFLDSWVEFYLSSSWLKERRDYWFRDIGWAKQLD